MNQKEGERKEWEWRENERREGLSQGRRWNG